MATNVPQVQRLVLAAAVVIGCCGAFSRGGSAEERRQSEAQLFGLTASGSSFVYVFDRSLSMKGQPLAAAKKELVASINRLTRVQQFQIIFYNEKARSMQPPQMAFADENGLRAAESYIASVSASGGTDHMQALLLAMRMAPDVVFFLTDADDPQLTADELETIRQKNPGVTIHTIEFKSGTAPAAATALKTLADQNRGEYKYVDVSALDDQR